MGEAGGGGVLDGGKRFGWGMEVKIPAFAGMTGVRGMTGWGTVRVVAWWGVLVECKGLSDSS